MSFIVGKNSSEALPLDNRPFNSFFNFRRGQVKKKGKSVNCTGKSASPLITKIAKSEGDLTCRKLSKILFCKVSKF